MKPNCLNKHLATFLFLALVLIPSLNTASASSRLFYPSEDTYADSGYNEHPFGTASQLSVYSHTHDPVERNITYMKFDVSPIPPYATIDSAYLNVYATTCGGLTMPNKLYVGEVTSNWSASTLVWSNKPSYIANFSNLSISTTGAGYRQWSVRQLVKLWTTKVRPNYGLSMDFNADTSTLCHFNSSESRTYRPYITVNYTIPTFSVTDPKISDVSARTAKFEWTTTGFKSDTYVYYGLPGTLTQLKGTNEAVTQHTYTLVGLSPETRYEYRLLSKDSYNTAVKSQAFYFTTKADPAPVRLVPPQRQVVNILNVKVTEITDSSAKVSWETSREASGYLVYGQENNEVDGGGFESTAFTLDHSTMLSNLKPETRYLIKIGAGTEDGASADLYSSSFKTKSIDQVAEVDEDQASEEIADSEIPDAATSEPGTGTNADDASSADASQKKTSTSDQEIKLTGLQEFIVSLMSNPLLLTLSLSGTFLIISLIVFIVFVVIIVKLLKRSKKPKEPAEEVESPPTKTSDSPATSTEEPKKTTKDTKVTMS